MPRAKATARTSDVAVSELEAGGLRPFLKWAGRKRRLVPNLVKLVRLPARRLVEPFCGSAAVSLALHERAEAFWLNDANPDLAGLFRVASERCAALAKRAEALFDPASNTEEAYYRLREAFNAAKRGSLERSALFLYLNRHGYNGLCRYNASGLYNVPFGRYAQVSFQREELEAAGGLLRKARITCGDFEPVLAECGDGDLVYCDPPYVPLSATASFTAYAKGGFSPADQERLVAASRAAAGRGATVVLSNHDTPGVRRLYRGAELVTVDVRRSISRDAANRGTASEVIAVFRPGR
jgi:DNA adenine methylase